MAADTAQLLPFELARVPRGLRLALAQEGIPFRDMAARPEPSDEYGRFVLFDSHMEQCPLLRPGQQAIDIGILRKAAAPDDAFEALEDERSATGTWRIGPLELREEIACHNKLAVRQAVMNGLRAMIEAAGGIWLRLAPYPFPYRSALCFRIDYDEYHPGDFRRTLEAIDGFEHATSHYVSGAAYEKHREALALMRGLDVGSHGYWHHIYRDADENRRNISRGIDVLCRAGIEPQGFVSPHGRFHAGLLRVLESLGIGHSSEFGLAYDELPFFPRESSVLQLPIHPVCLGLFLEADHAATPHKEQPSSPPNGKTAITERVRIDLAQVHFRRTARSRYLAGLPVFLYGHPTRRIGRYPWLIRGLLQEIADYPAIWPVTFTQFAEWWKFRQAVRMSVWQRGEALEVCIRSSSKRFPLAVEYCRGEQHFALVPMATNVLRFSPDALAYERRRPIVGQASWRIDPAQPLRQRLLRWIDWERVTPLEEIRGRSVRQVAKRALRRLRDGRRR